MSTLIASYDGVMFFNRDVNASNAMCCMYKSLLMDWLKISNFKASHGDISGAKQAFEVAAAYARLTLQKVKGV